MTLPAYALTTLLLTLALLQRTVHAQIYLECRKASYCFAIDESTSINNAEYTMLRTAAISLISHIGEHAPGSYFIAHGFTTQSVEIESGTNVPFDATAAIQSHVRSTGDTKIASGLQACHESLKDAPGPGVTILFSNGGEETPTGAKAADALREDGFIVFSIGVGQEPDDTSLDEIADNQRRDFEFSEFSDIATSGAELAQDVCDAIPIKEGICPDKCPAAAVCFAVDESGSISKTSFMLQSNVLAGITSVFSTFAPQSMFAGVGFADEAHVFQSLTFNPGMIMDAFLSNKQRTGGSSSGSALLRCGDILKGVPGPKVIVLIADGDDNKQPIGKDVASMVKAMGIRIVTAGVGDTASENLKLIASPDTGKEYFTAVSKFPVFSQAIGPIMKHMCSAGAQWTPVPPPPSCGSVFCASCGEGLECYANTGFSETDARVCKAIMAGKVFCPKRKGTRTRCNQECKASGEGVMCYEGVSFGLSSSNPTCKRKDSKDGSTLFPTAFAKYRACKRANGKTSVACEAVKCNADKKGRVCFPENL